jgi:methionyl-tRNA formyltransferase
LKIAFASSSPVGIPIFNALLSTQHEILYVLTNPDKPTGRGQSFTANRFAEHARSLALQIFKPTDEVEIVEILRTKPVDAVLTVAYGQLIKESALHLPPYGWLNIHFSKLPTWRGAAPVQYAILHGQTQTGVSIFRLEAGMDTGPVFESWTTPIENSDTTESLLKKLSEESSLKVGRILDSIEAGQQPSEQNSTGISYAPKIKKEMGKISAQDSRVNAMAKIRALGENPGTYVTFRGQRLGIISAQLSYAHLEEPALTAPTGTLVAGKNELLLSFADGFLRLERVLPQGKKPMSGADFARGARLAPGELCE